ncbi:RNA ligase family protein [Streptomyces albipurpureus]|uniref:AAA family ATPase n=1 Tax=Streptomyces albipurpureus TaxID=2897419 RepID=A0ABT0UX20_9ACTN|nr:RNA ligase family protein [Streptomyces sp. CWNU-1]MCM2393124.1 AAA family ATPase [Streptomyces sp. CWNU-1]
MRTHYPRTPHLPWSPGATSDDVRTGDLSHLIGREVVVTEKLDGENTTLYGDGLHARSLDSVHHPSRAWVKALQSRIAQHIPTGWRISGENMYARHSLPYDQLDSYFYGFSVWDADGHCLDWDRTVPFLRGLGIPTPSVLWRGTFDERALRALRLDLSRQEGYVVRTAEGFADTGFRHRVAKWVRAGHVRTDTHWMHSAVVANGLGPAAALWSVRSGGPASVEELAHALGVTARASDAVVAEVADRLGQTGDGRLTAVLAALLHGERRSTLTARLRPTLGMRLARQVADVIGLAPGLQRPYPDEERPTGLLRLSYAADLGVLHTVAAATAQTTQEREQSEWSALYAEEIRAWQPPRFDGLGPDAADRCRAEAREAYAEGRIGGPEEAAAATWRWRDGDFPQLVHMVGPSGSGKSTFARGLRADVVVSLDELREAAGSRADQRGNGDVLRTGLNQLDQALGAGGTVVWDATSLNRHQRALVRKVARRRNALLTHAVMVVDEVQLVRRNAGRAHAVPREVLESQLRRYEPPYPGRAHRTWYIGPDGTIEDKYGDGDSHADE